MVLSSFEWSVIGSVATLAVGIIVFFLKRTMSKTDEHDKNINHIKQTYVTKDELDKAIAALQNEVREIKSELREENKKLVADVTEIKDNYIRKDDFYRTISDLTRTVDKVYEFLIKDKGGFGGGK